MCLEVPNMRISGSDKHADFGSVAWNYDQTLILDQIPESLACQGVLQAMCIDPEKAMWRGGEGEPWTRLPIAQQQMVEAAAREAAQRKPQNSARTSIDNLNRPDTAD